MQKLPDGVRPGVAVRARGATWVVVQTTTYDDCALVTLEGRDETNRGARARLLSPFDDLKPAGGTAALRRRPRPTLAAAALSALARVRPVDGLWTAVDGRFSLLPWQLSPALAVVGGSTRLLLADEVGLGKTIQACLVLSELVARGLVDRALVLTPPALRRSWADELRQRFGLPAVVLDHDALAESAIDLPPGVNPWAARPLVISSIDLAKRPEVRVAIEDEPIDLLIVDEAHHLTPGTDRGAVVERLARRVPWLVLVTATPHAGDDGAFRYLMNLGRAGDDPEPMHVFRRARTEVGQAGLRRSHTLSVRPTAAEAALLSSIRAYTTAMRRGPMASTPGLRLLASFIARRATSSALALERTLGRRLALLTSGPEAADDRQATLPWSEVEDSDDTPEAEWLSTPAMADLAGECEWLRALIALAADARAQPSKLLRLERLLRRAGEPAIVFTEFRDTLDACRPVATAVAPIVCLHGGLDVRDREAALAEFTTGRAPLLLATDVASEGLNLQHRCRLVITVEWPWSPQRLEQRIGRVDRIGQTRRVHAVHLTASGTFEESVVARLVRRRRLADDDLRIAAAPTFEIDVEAAVFDEPCVPRSGPASLTRQTAPDRAAALETARIAERRRLALLASGRARPAAGWAWPVRHGAGARIALVLELTEMNRHGLITSRDVIAVDVTLACRPGSKGEWRALCRRLANEPRVRQTTLAAAPVARGRISRAAARVEALRTALAGERHPAVQPSLFDSRSVREAEHQRTRLARIDRRLRRTQQALEGQAAARVELDVLAVIPLG